MRYTPAIQAVFLDIDGTIYSNRTNAMAKRALEAISKARKNGVLIFACTGRHTLEIEELNMEDVSLDGWLILNGAICYNEKEIYFKSLLNQDDVNTVIDECEKRKIPCLFIEKDDMYMNFYNKTVAFEQAAINTSLPPLKEMKVVRNKDIYMVVPYTTEENWRPVQQKLKHTKVTSWSNIALDVYSKDCGKGTAVEKTLAYYNIPKENSLAIGDGPNDIEMFESVGISIAMGNAKDIVKEYADDITSDVDECGVYNAFVKYGIIEGDG